MAEIATMQDTLRLHFTFGSAPEGYSCTCGLVLAHGHGDAQSLAAYEEHGAHLGRELEAAARAREFAAWERGTADAMATKCSAVTPCGDCGGCIAGLLNPYKEAL